jgi:hypothetical protein
VKGEGATKKKRRRRRRGVVRREGDEMRMPLGMFFGKGEALLGNEPPTSYPSLETKQNAQLQRTYTVITPSRIRLEAEASVPLLIGAYTSAIHQMQQK